MAVSFLALGAAAVPALWLSVQPPAGPRQRLPDGRVLELRGVTYGREHTFVWGNFWQRLLLMLPGSATSTAIGGYRETETTSADELHVWLDEQYPKPAEQVADPEYGSWIGVIIDAHGCRLRCSYEGGSAPPIAQTIDGGSMHFGPPAAAMATTIPVFPRRGGAATYALLRQGHTDPLVMFRLPVLPRRPYPTWKARLYPITVRRGGTDFTLVRMNASSPWADDPIGKYLAHFAYAAHGKPNQHWMPVSATVTDSGGNVVDSWVDSGRPAVARFAGLCRRESAWKVSVLFACADPASEPPDALWTVRDVRSPSPGHFTTCSAATRVCGATLRLQRIVAAGKVKLPDHEFLNLDEPTLTLEQGGPDPGVQVSVLRVTDQRGRVVHEMGHPEHGWAANSWVPMGGQSSTEFLSLEHAPPGRLSFTFAIHRLRRVEFLAKP